MTNADVLAAIDDPAGPAAGGSTSSSTEPATLTGSVFATLRRASASPLEARVHALGGGSRMLDRFCLACGDVTARHYLVNPRFQLLNDQMLAARGRKCGFASTAGTGCSRT
jgi:hypothetical protein